MITPFDLHVLSTPPAFILSQDQTLDKKFNFYKTEIKLQVSVRQKLPGFCKTRHVLFSTCLVWFRTRTAWLPVPFTVLFFWNSLEFSGLHYCSFVKVLSIGFPDGVLSCGRFVSDTAFVYYHSCKYPSRHFFTFFIFSFPPSWTGVVPVSGGGFLLYHRIPKLVKALFDIFCHFLQNAAF